MVCCTAPGTARLRVPKPGSSSVGEHETPAVLRDPHLLHRRRFAIGHAHSRHVETERARKILVSGVIIYGSPIGAEVGP